MKKIFFKTMLLLLTAGMSVACSSDNDSVDPDEVQTPVTITARYGSINTTRVAYADDGANINATWQENDKLLVLHKNMVNTLTLSSGAGASTATFKGTVKGSLKENSMLIPAVSRSSMVLKISFFIVGLFVLSSMTWQKYKKIRENHSFWRNISR